MLYDVLVSSNGPRSRINCAVRHILQHNKILRSDEIAWNIQLSRILRTFPSGREPRGEKIVIDTEVCPFEPNYWKVRRV